MHILVAPDSFKGSGSAKDIGNTIKQAIQLEISDATVDVTPMADGGEGTIDALLYSSNGMKVNLEVTGPTGDKADVYYGVLEDSETVIIEVASIVGFTFVTGEKCNPLNLTTYGIGECILHALDSGYTKFIFCLGGSATNDGGLGMLQALGVNFQNQDGDSVSIYPESIEEIETADYSNLDSRIWKADMRVASDVQNPLCGINGATYIFGPQKGLEASQLEPLDRKIKLFAEHIEGHLEKEFQYIPGSGAAGGLGFALLTIGAEMESGAELIARSLNLEENISQYDWVITGEGRTDYQTLQGKLPYVVAKMAKKQKIPTILISGSIESDLNPLYDVFDSMHSITNGPLTLEDSINNMESLLHHCTKNIARLLKYTI